MAKTQNMTNIRTQNTQNVKYLGRTNLTYLKYARYSINVKSELTRLLFFSYTAQWLLHP